MFEPGVCLLLVVTRVFKQPYQERMTESGMNSRVLARDDAYNQRIASPKDRLNATTDEEKSFSYLNSLEILAQRPVKGWREYHRLTDAITSKNPGLCTTL